MAGDIMIEEEFDNLAFVHGSNPADWPDEVSAQALAFAESSASGRARLEQLRRLEGAMASVKPEDPKPSVDLLSRILADAAALAPEKVIAAPTPSPRQPSLLSQLRSFLSPAAACAASAALGLWLGYAGPVDFADVASDTLGVELATEFAMLDDLGVSPIAGVFDVLEGSE